MYHHWLPTIVSPIGENTMVLVQHIGESNGGTTIGVTPMGVQ